MEAKALRLLRQSTKAWWYFKQLRTRGDIATAAKLERASIRDTIKLMRTAEIETLNFPRYYITFKRPADVTSWTTSISNVHTGELAAWVYLYAKGLVK